MSSWYRFPRIQQVVGALGVTLLSLGTLAVLPMLGPLGLWLLLSHSVSAKDLGVVGPTFSIVETDMLHVIEQRLTTMAQSGELTHLEDEFKARSAAQAQRPKPVAYLTTTTTPKTVTLDPSIVLDHDILDANGDVLYPQGMIINPFDPATWPDATAHSLPVLTFNKVLAFFDADDPQQLAWAQALIDQETQPIQWILTRGEPSQAAQVLQARTFFDLEGYLSERFALEHIPALVRQVGTQWQVQTIDVSNLAPKIVDEHDHIVKNVDGHQPVLNPPALRPLPADTPGIPHTQGLSPKLKETTL